MRILHINCNYLGTTLHQLMVERLDALSTENKVFVPVHSATKSVITPRGNVVVSNCFKRRDRVVFDYKQSKIYKAIKSSVNVGDYDLIHAYTLFTDGNVSYRLSREYGKKYVVAVRNTDVNDFFAKMIHLRSRGVEIMRHAERVFFLSEAYKSAVFSKYIPAKYKDEILKKSVVIPNGIDRYWLDNAYQSRAIPSGNKISLVCACGIDKNKNIEATQQAMKLLLSEGYDVSLTVAGKQTDKRVFESVFADKHTTYAGCLAKEKLIEYYRGADIFVMPSFHESFGLVYAEAMSQGLPIIYTRGQGFDGQFAEGRVGYHVDASEPKQIAECIKKIIGNYAALSASAAENAHKFDWDGIAREYIQIYSNVLSVK